MRAAQQCSEISKERRDMVHVQVTKILSEPCLMVPVFFRDRTPVLKCHITWCVGFNCHITLCVGFSYPVFPCSNVIVNRCVGYRFHVSLR